MSSTPQGSSHLSPTRNSIAVDQYDHAINLVDNTRPPSPPNVPEDPGTERESSRNSTTGISDGDATPVRKTFSKSAFNQEFNRRRYARFQEQKYNEETDSKNDKPGGKGRAVLKSLEDKRGRALDRLRLRAKKAGKAIDTQSTVDILYENQRGLFLFGYPLYSSRSLLNFDPAAWTNAQFKYSAVDILNAQVPDPTWTWSWKRWYVDMTGDVDEQGWQYSLTFGKSFSWHGTHPWFHSLVRRRRWLRKRVKIQRDPHTVDAHHMAQDYFTIHSNSKTQSHGSSITSNAFDKSNRLGATLDISDSSEGEDDIDNIVTLLNVMKNTAVDRKKLGAFKNFLKHGGDEVQLLPEMLPQLWGLFLYQNSRRELLSIIEQAEHQHELEQEGSTAKLEDSTSKTKDLQTTITLIRDSLSQIEFYSDARAMEKEIKEHEAGHIDIENHTEKNEAQQQLEQTQPSREPSKDTNIETTRVMFKGIPKTAELDIASSIARPKDVEASEAKD